MNNERQFQQIPSSKISKACAELESHGFQIFEIGKPANAQELFTQAKAAYPLDPQISGNVHWDAFADSLWGGLDACPHPKIALVIQDVTEFSKTSLRDYDIALSCVADATMEVEAEKRHAGNDEAEIILLIGIGE